MAAYLREHVRPAANRYRAMRLFALVFSLVIALLIVAGHHRAATMTALQHPVAAANQVADQSVAAIQGQVADAQARGVAVADRAVKSVSDGGGIRVFVERQTVRLANGVYDAGTTIGDAAVTGVAMVWAFAIWVSSMLLNGVFDARPGMYMYYQSYDSAVRSLAAVLLVAAGFLLSGPLVTWWRLRRIATPTYRAHGSR